MYTLVTFEQWDGEKNYPELILVKHENGNELDAICNKFASPSYKGGRVTPYTYKETLTVSILEE